MVDLNKLLPHLMTHDGCEVLRHLYGALRELHRRREVTEEDIEKLVNYLTKDKEKMN